VGEERVRTQRGHAVAILEATVRSLSSLALFRSKACWRQSSSLLQLWCSGRRCAPQNSDRQCGHWPTMRRTAELQGVSAWSWQRFLGAMVWIRGSRGMVVGRGGGRRRAGLINIGAAQLGDASAMYWTAAQPHIGPASASPPDLDAPAYPGSLQCFANPLVWYPGQWHWCTRERGIDELRVPSLERRGGFSGSMSRLESVEARLDE
jgi:hypothetical protein